MTTIPFIILILIFGLNEKIGFPDYAFVISDHVLINAAGNILFMCQLILFARICPPGIEGFFMTILTSISNAAGAICYQISSGITDALGIQCVESEENENEVDCNFKRLWLLVVIVNLSTLLPLMLIMKIPDETQLKEINEKLKESSDDVVDDDEEDGRRDGRKLPDRDDMIGLYWFCMERVCVCKCCRDERTYTVVNEPVPLELKTDEYVRFE